MTALASRNVRDNSWGRPTNMKVTPRGARRLVACGWGEESVLDVFVWDVVLADAVYVVGGLFAVSVEGSVTCADIGVG